MQTSNKCGLSLVARRVQESSRSLAIVVGATAFFALSNLALAQQYSITDLGLVNGQATSASAINASGQIVVQTFTADGSFDPQVYTPGSGYYNLATDPLKNYSVATIADNGKVAGYSEDSTTLLDTPVIGQAGTQPLSPAPVPSGAVDAFFTGISPSGSLIAGNYTTSGDGRVGYVAGSNGTLIRALSQPDDSESFVTSVNNAGTAVGTNESFSSGDEIAAAWTSSGGFQSIGHLQDGQFSEATGINSHGIVVGTSAIEGSGSLGHAFIAHSNGGGGWSMTDINSLDGISLGNSINDNNLVVGTSIFLPSEEGEGQEVDRGFLYINGGMLDLNTLLPADSGLNVTAALGINNNGQIAANAVDADGVTHAVLLNPVSTPVMTANHPLTTGPNDVGTVGGTANGGGVSGHVTATGGTLVVKYDPQVALTDLTSSASPFDSAQPNFVVAGDGLYAQAWDISIESGTLASATLTFHFDPSDLPDGTDLSSLQLYHFDSTLGQWVLPPGEVINTTDDTITLTTSSFSPFVLGEAVTPEPASLSLLAISGVLFLRRHRDPRSDLI